MTYHFVLAVTTYNRLNYLRECLESFEKTKCKNTWTIIVADDGSTDGTQEYVKRMGYKLIENHRVGVNNQTNSLFQEIIHLDFDCCFKIDDDITFLKEGWSTHYHDSILKTGYEHLVFSEQSRCVGSMKHRNRRTETTYKYNLRSYCDYVSAMGCFFTVTKRTLQMVGYFDTTSFGPHESGHVDFTGRCCDAGMNDFYELWDVNDSEQYISLKQNENYIDSLPPHEREKRRSKFDPITNEIKFIEKSNSRIYCPFNSTMYSVELPKSSVIIGVYNSKSLRLVLEGYTYQTDKDFEIIVINDGGDEMDVLSLLRLYRNKLNIQYDMILPKTNEYRLSMVRNIGTEMARGTRIITTDADCIPDPEFIKRHNCAVGIKIGIRNRIYQTIARNISLNTIKNIRHIPYYYDERLNYLPVVKWSNENAADLAWGCNVSYDKSTLLKAGNFNIEYIGWGFEDCDMALRVLRLNNKIEIDTECIVYHLEHTTKCDWSNQNQLNNLNRYKALKSNIHNITNLVL